MTQSSPAGRFVWYELMTSDPDAAMAFYTDVIGWGTTPFEGAPMPYTMWTKGEQPVGGVLEMPAEAGAPPTWMAHVRVDDVDAVAVRVEELGGRILNGPESLEEVGRWVVFGDPQGAVIAAFRPETEMSPGPDEPEPGDVSWNELGTSDHQAALEFYSDLFGWEKQDEMDMGDAGVYRMYGTPGGPMLGGMYNRSPEMPGPDRPAWLFYIRVADLDGAVERVKDGGGTIVVEPMEVPGGSRIAVGLDPQGAAFGLHSA